MKHPHITLVFTIIAAAIMHLPLLAGTLDNAPFQISVPNGDWKLDDSTSREMGKDVFITASLTNSKLGLKSVVITTSIKPSASALDQLCTGIRESLNNPIVKTISDTETTFLGHRGRAFVYEVTQAGQTTYNESRVFLDGNTGWTIAFSGPSSQKETVQQMITFYRSK